jgi:hypothetical protein
MASTYSTNLRIELVGSGEQSGTWDTTLNTQLGTILEEAISGRAAITHDDSANYSLTTNNGTTDEARQMIIDITGGLSQARNTVVPTSDKLYVAMNSDSFDTTFKTTAGTGILVPAGKTTLLVCDGTNVVDAINMLTELDMNGGEVVLDADGDTSITADTDDQIDIKIAGADDFSFKANTFEVQTGSNIDMNGTELVLDADGDTSITADTDDTIDFRIAGADDFQMTANTLSVLSGSTLNIDSGATIANSGTATGFGGVDTTGTPANNQLAIFTDADTVEGDSGLTWSGTVLTTTGAVIAGDDSQFGTGTMLGSRTFEISADCPPPGGLFTATQEDNSGEVVQLFTTHATYGGQGIEYKATRSSTTSMNLFNLAANGGSDLKFRVTGSGTVTADGTITGCGADYAEFFLSVSGLALVVGATVVLENGKVRPSTPQDSTSDIIGVVRPKSLGSRGPLVRGNSAWNQWTDKYLVDDFGSYIMEDHVAYEWREGKKRFSVEVFPDGTQNPADLVIPEGAKLLTTENDGSPLQHQKLNPAYNPELTYIPREDREEWQVIGLLGQMRVAKGQPIGDRWTLLTADISDSADEYFVR